ncbi:MAG: aminotransferase class I/II-fold pyridoxal phosphate-dependent enzyme, partial [Sarcina sp.]
KGQYKYLIKEIETLKKKIKSIKYLNIMDETFFSENKSNEVFMDNTRIVLNLKKGFSGNKLLEYLREKNIQCEMSDYKNVVLIPTPFNYTDDFIKLYEALITCDIKRIKQQEVNFYDCEIPNMKMLPFKVINTPKILIDLDESEGLIASENIIPYPPGVPLLIMGELIKINHINLIKSYIYNNVTVIGVYNNKIKVLQL